LKESHQDKQRLFRYVILNHSIGLWPLACWDYEFESYRGHGCFLLWVLCFVRYRSLRRADHSSRGVLPTVVRRCVWSRNLVNEETLAHWGLSRQKKERKLTHCPAYATVCLLRGTNRIFKHVQDLQRVYVQKFRTSVLLSSPKET